MDQLRKLLADLSLKQKISLALVAVLVAAGLYAAVQWKSESDFRPLYSGMSAEDAGAVVQKLRESGTEFRLGENGASILVPSAKISELRLQMASAGLPKTGRAGFELFDKNNFGATDFAEHINFRRALEGELERSIMALTEVETARVHVTFPKDSIFLEARQPAKASVMVRLKPGASLSPQNVTAVCHLVSSAVESLAPESVSVLDMSGNLLSRRRTQLGGDQPSEAALEYKQQVEKDLLAKVNSTLEPLLGPERFRAGVSVECDFTSGEQSEETYDPARSVMTSSQKSEDVSGGSLASGVPGTASNLPRPVSRPAGSGTGFTRRSENITYQSSRTVRHLRTPQGGVKRLSVSVLVDQDVRWEGTGAQAKRFLEPPSPEKLKVIRDLVVGVTGFDANRGDQLIVETLPFDSTLRLEPPPARPSAVPAPKSTPNPLRDFLERKDMVVIGVAAGAGILLLLTFGWLLFGRRGRKSSVDVQAAIGSGQEQNPVVASSPENTARQLEAQLAENDALRLREEEEILRTLKAPPGTTKKKEVLAKHLAETVKKDPVPAAQIIRGWMRDTER